MSEVAPRPPLEQAITAEAPPARRAVGARTGAVTAVAVVNFAWAVLEILYGLYLLPGV